MSHKPIPENIRKAIAGFLDRCQKEARPIASSEAVGAIRQIFPGLELTDHDLLQAFVDQASAAGFSVGITDNALHVDSQKRIDTDTDGTRRRQGETKERNRLL